MTRKKTTRGLMVLAVSGIIVMFVMKFETNANKHIHIPEYILITWILYQALAFDYKGSGILLLVFICAAMLGVVDEIMQGIHPQRTFGGTDMIGDAAASPILQKIEETLNATTCERGIGLLCADQCHPALF